MQKKLQMPRPAPPSSRAWNQKCGCQHWRLTGATCCAVFGSFGSLEGNFDEDLDSAGLPLPRSAEAGLNAGLYGMAPGGHAGTTSKGPPGIAAEMPGPLDPFDRTGPEYAPPP